MYQKQLRVWVACLVSPFCHFKGAKLYICHLARGQCFKLEFPKETEHDFEGGVFENCLTMSLFNVQFDHLTHGESSPGNLARIYKKGNVLQLHSKVHEYLCNWATSSAAFSETAGASCKCIFI